MMQNKEKQNKSGTAVSMNENFKKATVEMMLLYILRDGKKYVYEMMQELSRKSEGIYQVATLYPAIYRLSGFGYIQEAGIEMSPDNRTRKYYAITDSGRNYFSELEAEYHRMCLGIEKIFFFREDRNI